MAYEIFTPQQREALALSGFCQVQAYRKADGELCIKVYLMDARSAFLGWDYSKNNAAEVFISHLIRANMPLPKAVKERDNHYSFRF